MNSKQRNILNAALFLLFGITLIALAVAILLTGSEPLPIEDVVAALLGRDVDESVRNIVLTLRLPKVVVAILAGMALSASGLLMQTLFRNPLAGPYVLGISSGASLGVALLTLATPYATVWSYPWMESLGTAGMAWLGSAAVLLMVMTLTRRIKSISVILIIGMMLGSVISAIVGVMQYMAAEESLKTFMVWTMGSLQSITLEQMHIFVPMLLVGLVVALAVVKPLDMLLLGEGYARTMGLRIGLSRALIFLSTTLLAGSVTAFCGPIGFIGLAIPHLARFIFRTASHRVLMPATMLLGAVALLLCAMFVDMVAHNGLVLPINTVTSLLGIPIIIFVILRNRNCR